MQNWQKDRNYRKYKNTDGTYSYFITLDKDDIEVSAEVYNVYSQSDRRERYCAERDVGRFLSMECMEDDNLMLSYLTDRHVESAEDTSIRKLLMEQALAALWSLEDSDRLLLTSLVMDGVTEREYAELTGMSQKGINKRKHRALEKIRKIIGTQTA